MQQLEKKVKDGDARVLLVDDDRQLGSMLGDYFADPFDGELDRLLLLSGSLSPDGVGQMKQRLEDVAREFDGLLARDASLPAERRVGVSLVLAQKPWLLRLFEPYRRARD